MIYVPIPMILNHDMAPFVAGEGSDQLYSGIVRVKDNLLSTLLTESKLVLVAGQCTDRLK